MKKGNPKLVVISVMFMCFLVLQIGCAQTRFCHPTKSAADFEREKYDCENIAYQKASDFGAKGNPLIIADEIKRCLQLKYGWRPCN